MHCRDGVPTMILKNNTNNVININASTINFKVYLIFNI